MEQNKKLIAYSATAVAFIGGPPITNAEVVYTDLNPDVQITVPNTVYQLDLNNDGTDDFMFGFFSTYVFYFTYYGGHNLYAVNALYAFPLGNNSIAGSTGLAGAYAYPYALPLGFPIGYEEEQFQNQYTQTLAFQFYAIIQSYLYYPIVLAGDWILGAENKFVGLKLIDNDSAYYGWARLDIGADHRSITIRDYAYNNAADSTIETSIPVSINEQTLTGVTVFENNNALHISIPEKMVGKAALNLLDMQGMSISNTLLTSQENIISTRDIPAAIYIAEIIYEGQMISRKVFTGSK